MCFVTGWSCQCLAIRIRVYVMQLVDVSKCHPSFLSLIIRGYKGQLYTDLEVRRQPLP